MWRRWTASRPCWRRPSTRSGRWCCSLRSAFTGPAASTPQAGSSGASWRATPSRWATAAAALYLFRLQEFSRGVLFVYFLASSALLTGKRAALRAVLRHIRREGLQPQAHAGGGRRRAGAAVYGKRGGGAGAGHPCGAAAPARRRADRQAGAAAAWRGDRRGDHGARAGRALGHDGCDPGVREVRQPRSAWCRSTTTSSRRARRSIWWAI